MPKETRQKAAEHHEQAAKAHRTAAEQHGSNDHVNAKQQSAQAMEKSKTAHEHSTQANNKSQQRLNRFPVGAASFVCVGRLPDDNEASALSRHTSMDALQVCATPTCFGIWRAPHA